jgi:type IV pilus secretin PilQ/predicted competence protein
MRLRYLLLIIVVLGALQLPTGVCRAQESTGVVESLMFTSDQTITMNLRDVRLENALRLLTERTGMNFSMDTDLGDRLINVYLVDVSPEDALAAILRANGLWYTRQEGTNIYVIIAEEKGPPANTETRVLKCNYADAKELKPTVESNIGEVGKIVVDERTNSLVVTDTPENMRMLRALVEELDSPTGQVLIEARIVELTDIDGSDIGVTWQGYDELDEAALEKNVSVGGSFNYREKDLLDGLLKLTVGRLEYFEDPSRALEDLNVTLEALVTTGKAKLLATPQVLTVNNKEAKIEITESVALAKKVTINGLTGQVTEEIVFGDIGVTLSVTPHINDENFITMVVSPVVSSARKSTFFPDEAADTKKRTATTTVMVKDAQTIVIGGLLRNEESETFYKVPLLGDIPLLNLLFRKKVANTNNNEVVVFLTPRIVTADELMEISRRGTGIMSTEFGEHWRSPGTQKQN